MILLERNRYVFQAATHPVPPLENRLLTVLYNWIIGSVDPDSGPDPDVFAFVAFLDNLINSVLFSFMESFRRILLYQPDAAL